MLKVASIILLLGFMFVVDGQTDTRLEEKSLTLVLSLRYTLYMFVTMISLVNLLNRNNPGVQMYSFMVLAYILLIEYTKCDHCY